MNRLTVIVGAPAAGKTTFAQALDGHTRICLDDIREELTGDASSQEATASAVAVAKVRLVSILGDGGAVVLDATSTTRRERADWIGLAMELGVGTVATVIHPPLAVCLARNASRDRQVPEDVVEEMWRRVDRITVTELLDEGVGWVERIGGTT